MAVNERNAGRKPVISAEKLEELQKRHKAGEAISALAKEVGVSRQTLSHGGDSCTDRWRIPAAGACACRSDTTLSGREISVYVLLTKMGTVAMQQSLVFSSYKPCEIPSYPYESSHRSLTVLLSM